MKQPSWKNMLSYETNKMSREEIVRETYDSALKLNQFKRNHNIISQEVYEEVMFKIKKSLEYLQRLDEIELLSPERRNIELNIIKKEVDTINRHSICGQNELKWEVKKLFADFPSLTLIGLELLVKDIVNGIKCRVGKIDRNMVYATGQQRSSKQK